MKLSDIDLEHPEKYETEDSVQVTALHLSIWVHTEDHSHNLSFPKVDSDIPIREKQQMMYQGVWKSGVATKWFSSIDELKTDWPGLGYIIRTCTDPNDPSTFGRVEE